MVKSQSENFLNSKIKEIEKPNQTDFNTYNQGADY